MDIFFALLIKIFPLYILIFLGYLATKYVKVKKEAVAGLLIYIIGPIVLFAAIANMTLSSAALSLPLIFLIIPSIVAFVTFQVASLFWKDSNRNMLGFVAGSANSGYFGIPVAVALYDNSVIGIVALCTLGSGLYNSTYGYYLAARGNRTVRQSLIEVAKLPLLYASAAGLLAHAVGWHVGGSLKDLVAASNGSLIVMGMMLIGMGLADIKKFDVDLKFIGLGFVGKFVMWPALMLALLTVDRHFLHMFDDRTQTIILVLSAVPFAANIVSYATILKSHPEKSALAVFASTVFALFWIPIIVALFT